MRLSLKAPHTLLHFLFRRARDFQTACALLVRVLFPLLCAASVLTVLPFEFGVCRCPGRAYTDNPPSLQCSVDWGDGSDLLTPMEKCIFSASTADGMIDHNDDWENSYSDSYTHGKLCVHTLSPLFAGLLNFFGDFDVFGNVGEALDLLSDHIVAAFVAAAIAAADQGSLSHDQLTAREEYCSFMRDLFPPIYTRELCQIDYRVTALCEGIRCDLAPPLRRRRTPKMSEN
jgi:hypothetical protein